MSARRYRPGAEGVGCPSIRNRGKRGVAGLGGSAAERKQGNALTGALLMVFASACWAGMAGLIRHISLELHPFEVAFFRTFFAVVLMTPWLIRAGRSAIPPRRDWHIFGLRAAIHLVAMLSWFMALTMMPLAEAVALFFTAPFFATILAVIFLGEIVRMRRWAAVAVGLAGAMIVLRPGIEEITLGALLVLTCAVFSAGSRISVRFLTARSDANAIVAIHFILLTPMVLVPALFVWQWPSWDALAWMAALAGLGTVGHIALTRAYTIAEASHLAPFDFTQLLVAAAIGYFLFAEVPDEWTWIGSALIAGSAIYIARREAMVQKQRAATTAAQP
jgi:drug/metabolite transporter (DMT)-like permease